MSGNPVLPHKNVFMQELMAELKKRYKKDISGKVACRGEYGLMSGICSFEVEI
jgi:hypothetical protein